MDEKAYVAVPEELEVREVRVRTADPKDLPRLWEIRLRAVGRHRVGNRPDRYEPGAVKRRAEPIALVTVPRDKARRKLGRDGPPQRPQPAKQESDAACGSAIRGSLEWHFPKA